MSIQTTIREYIQQHMIMLNDEISFTDEDDIFQRGFVNSLFSINLLNFIEQQFQIVVDNVDLELSNFNTVNNIVHFIEKKQKIVQNN